MIHLLLLHGGQQSSQAKPSQNAQNGIKIHSCETDKATGQIHNKLINLTCRKLQIFVTELLFDRNRAATK